MQAVIFTVLMIAAIFTDLRWRLIPDTLCLGIALTSLLAFQPQNMAGLFIASFPLVIARLFGGFEGGDIKLMAAAGLVLGFRQSLAAVIIGFFVLLVYAMIYAAARKMRVGDVHRLACPLAPFLSLGFLTAYFIF